MKLQFIGLSPSPALEKVLVSHGFEVESVKRLPPPPKAKTEPPDLVAYTPKTLSALKDVDRLRQFYPQAWIAVVAPKGWLKDAASQNALIKCDAKNEVWLEDWWEATFWFSLHQMLNHRKLSAEVHELRAEREALRATSEELTRRSQSLVAQLEQDVGLASNIQRSVLPKFSPSIPGISIAVKYVPAAGIGGDYYDIFEFGDRKRFGVLIADSRTHGMAAALLSVLLKVRTDEMKDRFPNSHSFVEHLNREFQQMNEKNLSSLAVLYGILDRSTLTFQYTVAGHLRPLLWRLGAPAPLVVAGNPPLGGADHYAFRENTIALKPGDLLIMHTDGLEAPLQETGRPAFERIVEILKNQDPSPDPLEVQNELMALVDQYIQKKALPDDVTLIHFAIDERALYVAQNK